MMPLGDWFAISMLIHLVATVLVAVIHIARESGTLIDQLIDKLIHGLIGTSLDDQSII